MSDAPNPAQAAAHASPAKVGKAGKNFLTRQPKWVLIAGAVVMVGIAYYMYRARAAAAADTASSESMTTGEVYSSSVDGASAGGDWGGGSYVTAPPTQGAYGGYDSPDLVPGDGGGGILGDIIYNIAPGPQYTPPEQIPTSPAPPTGGGLPPSNPAAHAVSWSDARAVVAGVKSGAITAAPKGAETAPAGFPHKSSRGWYRTGRDMAGAHKGQKFHLYQTGEKVYVSG